MMNAAYADYYVPTHLSAEQIARMDEVYDVDLFHSVVAFVGLEPVAQALLARREERAWINSVGTIPSWRRCGIARAMVASLIAAAEEVRVKEIRLEVITQNSPARRLYESLGFEVSRELLTWRRSAEDDPLPIPAERLVPARAQELVRYAAAWRDHQPCWQREPETLEKLIPGGNLKGYWLEHLSNNTTRRDTRTKWGLHRKGGGMSGDAGVGYCLFSGADRGVSLVAVGIHPESDSLLPGRVLLQALAGMYPGSALSMMNIPADSRLNRVLAALRFRVTLRQWEMALHLR